MYLARGLYSYSVMQSVGNSFYEDFILDSFNIMKTVFKQNMKSKYLGIFIKKILILEVIEENVHLKKYSQRW